jgi:Kef-type K+ transport system membrane component KefB
MFKIQISLGEIIILSIFFTTLAIYTNIHKKNHVFSFLVNHAIAISIALVVSKLVYHYYNKLA